jgi:hypothetical protein
MAFCLIPKIANKFKQGIINGEINPEKLSNMTSEERHSFFAEHLGADNAEQVNVLFESKLLLKNQQQGIINWANKLVDVTPQVKQDIISKVERMDKVLNPAEEAAFLEDLTAHKLGTRVSYDEAQKISDLTSKMEDAKTAMDNGGDRLDYGRSRVELKNYLDELKLKADKFSFGEFKNNPGTALRKGITEIAGNTKAIQASMDNSAIFRQGWKVLWTNPTIWAKIPFNLSSISSRLLAKMR